MFHRVGEYTPQKWTLVMNKSRSQKYLWANNGAWSWSEIDFSPNKDQGEQDQEHKNTTGFVK